MSEIVKTKDSKRADLIESADWFETDETTKGHGDVERKVYGFRSFCGECKNDTFKVMSIDRSCQGCGHGADRFLVCTKCGAHND